MDRPHIPVMQAQCLSLLAVKPDGVYIDATLGRGGHAFAIAGMLTSGHVIGLDRDADAIAYVRRHAPAIKAVHGDFRHLDRYADIGGVDGILFDLGVSSPQIDEAERGFSYKKDAPLDMRMDQGQRLTAAEIVNEWPEEELSRILRDYGEERYAARIAAAIAAARKDKPVATTRELVGLITKAMPAQALREPQHPGARTFQALRIAVNDELAALESGLQKAVTLLKPGGRLAVITFHSLEDRIVKQFIRYEAARCVCPPKTPVCLCHKIPRLVPVTRKPVTADESEISSNPRARSAKLRAAEKAITEK